MHDAPAMRNTALVPGVAVRGNRAAKTACQGGAPSYTGSPQEDNDVTGTAETAVELKQQVIGLDPEEFAARMYRMRDKIVASVPWDDVQDPVTVTCAIAELLGGMSAAMGVSKALLDSILEQAYETHRGTPPAPFSLRFKADESLGEGLSAIPCTCLRAKPSGTVAPD